MLNETIKQQCDATSFAVIVLWTPPTPLESFFFFFSVVVECKDQRTNIHTSQGRTSTPTSHLIGRMGWNGKKKINNYYILSFCLINKIMKE